MDARACSGDMVEEERRSDVRAAVDAKVALVLGVTGQTGSYLADLLLSKGETTAVAKTSAVCVSSSFTDSRSFCFLQGTSCTVSRIALGKAFLSA